MSTSLQAPAPFVQMLERVLDRRVRPTIRIGGHDWSAFKVCGYTGLALSITLTMSLTLAQDLQPWVMLVIILTGMATFLTLAMATKIVYGEERLTYYHHEIAVIAVTTLLLWLLGKPVLSYLDVTILGVGAFLVCGRIGCLMVGCCHGQPYSWGVRYRQEHVAAGFNPHYIRARLIPVQALESGWVAFVVLIGVGLVLSDRPAGSALAWYIVMYDLGRFCFELLRGDDVRPYFKGFSEAQWISVGLMVVVVVLEWQDILPWHSWHLVALVGLLLAMVGIALYRRTRPRAGSLARPGHIGEIASALDLLESVQRGRAIETSSAWAAMGTPAIDVAVTSLGVRISSNGEIDGVTHYAISEESGMSPASASLVADLITRLRGLSGRQELLERNGVYHLLIHTPA